MRIFAFVFWTILLIEGALFATPSAAETSGSAECIMESVPREHELVAASIYRGETLANVVIDPAELSTIVRVFVAPGEKPVTVFLLGHQGIIWDFAGDLRRVRRVISTPVATAVRGLPRDRVEFPRLPSWCLLGSEQSGDTTQAREARAAVVARMLGRPADRDVAAYTVGQLNLPEATVSSLRVESPSEPAPQSRAERELHQSYPGGFLGVEVASLVSPVAIVVPRIFPGLAGLAQLEKEGAIRSLDRKEMAAWIEGASQPFRSKISPDFRLSVYPFDYTITRAVELPPLSRKRFLVSGGVPDPVRGAGPMVDCIAYIDGFRISDEQMCLSERSEIQALRRLPATDDPAQCRLLTVPPSASLEAVAAYEPKAGRGAAGAGKPAPIDVRITKPGEIVLVLSTYTAALWRISSGPDTRISGVLLIGYETSLVEGVAPQTPVVAVDYKGRTNRQKPDSVCAPFDGFLSTAYGGGPGALVLDRQVKVLTGRNLDRLWTAYALESVDIP